MTRLGLFNSGVFIQDLSKSVKSLTKDLLPNYADNAEKHDLKPLESMMSSLINEAKAKPLKAKTMAKTFANITVAVTMQLKHLHRGIDDAVNKLKSQLQKNMQLHEENAHLQHRCETSKQDTARAQAHANELATQLRASEKGCAELKETNAALVSSLHKHESDLCLNQSRLTEVSKQRDDSLVLLHQAKLETSDLQAQIGGYQMNDSCDKTLIVNLQKQLKLAADHSLSRQEAQSCHNFARAKPLSQTPQSPGVPAFFGLTDRDLDKIARNIPRFEPGPNGSFDANAYLKDIDFFLRKYPNATAEDRIYLIKVTSCREVSNFLERQPDHIRNDFCLLRQELEKEFSDKSMQTGFVAALAVKQGKLESPHQYYQRLLRAYFSSRNEPGMEDDMDFKSLFVHNLHPMTSYHLGVLANPQTSTAHQLRDLASLGFAKVMQQQNLQSVPNTVLNLDLKALPKNFEGAPGRQKCSQQTYRCGRKQNHFPSPQTHQGWADAKPPWPNRDHHNATSEPKHLPPAQRRNKNNHCYKTHDFSLGDTTDGNRQPVPHRKTKHTGKARTPGSSQVKTTRHLSHDKGKTDQPSNGLKNIGRKLPPGHRDAEPDVTASSMNHFSGIPKDKRNGSRQLRKKPMSPDTVLATKMDSNRDASGSLENPTFCRFLSDLKEKGPAKKFYLPITMEKVFVRDALIDSGADMTIMSSELFHELQTMLRLSNRDLKPQPCELVIQPYANTSAILTTFCMVHLAIGPMHIVHPVYVSHVEEVPFLVGKDLLDRFQPLIDFKNLKIWAQVPWPLPTSFVHNTDTQCFVLRTKEQSDPTETLAKQYALRGVTQPLPPEWLPDPSFWADTSAPTAKAMDLNVLAPAFSSNFLPSPPAPGGSGSPRLSRFRLTRHVLMGLSVLAHVAPASPASAVPRDQGGGMLTHGHDPPWSGHKGTRAEHNASRQFGYWQKVITNHIKGCTASYQLQLADLPYRTTSQDAKQFCSLDITMGRQMPLPLHLFCQSGRTSVTDTHPTHQYMVNRSKYTKAIFSFVQKDLDKNTKGHKVYCDQKASHEMRKGGQSLTTCFGPTNEKIQFRHWKACAQVVSRWTVFPEITDKAATKVFQNNTHGSQIKLHKFPMGQAGDHHVPIRL